MNPENRTDIHLFLVKWGKKERIWQIVGNEFGQVLKAHGILLPMDSNGFCIWSFLCAIRV
jgi:hypothetical protein